MDKINIELLEKLKEKIELVLNDDDIRSDTAMFYLEINKEELKTVNLLIDREIFKTPVNVEKSKVKGRLIGQCPVCRSYVLDNADFCTHCGQALSWTEFPERKVVYR